VNNPSPRPGAVRILVKTTLVGMGVLLIAFGSLSCARKPVKLRWKLEQGKTYVYKSDFTGTWRIEGWENGERGGTFGNLTMTTMQVTGVEDSAFRIHETTELIREGEKFTPTVYDYRLAPNGKLYGIESYDSGSAPRIFPSKERREQFFSETQPTYPDFELQPGEHWVQETKVVLDDRILTATNEFTVNGWEKVKDDMCLEISYSGVMIIPHKRGDAELLDNGKASGTIWFAPDKGLLIQQVDTLYVATTRVMPEGKKAPTATYIVESVRVYELQEIK